MQTYPDHRKNIACKKEESIYIYAWIDAQRDHYSVTRLCRVLGVSRTGYCQWQGRAPSARARANAILDAHVRQVHAGSRGSYGRPRIVQTLRRQGLSVGSERVRQSLRRQGLRPVYKRPYRVTTDSSHSLPVAPNTLDRRFDTGYPNVPGWLT